MITARSIFLCFGLSFCAVALLTGTVACGDPPTTRGAQAEGAAVKAAVTQPKPEEALVGYDLRRLRPRDQEPLAAMFDRLHAAALADGKRVAVLFSADWCAPCKRIEAELGNLHPAAMIGDVRIFELKEEEWAEATRMDEFNSLRARWYPKSGSYPVLVLIDAEGAAIEEMKVAIDRLEAEGAEATLPNWLTSTRTG